MMCSRSLIAGLAIVFLTLTPALSSAQLTSYSENFEGMSPSGASDLSDAGWLVFGNVFDGSNNYLYGYGPFAAPNGTGAFSEVATGDAGPGQGTFYVNAFSDYNNTGAHNTGTERIQSLLFQEQNIGAANLGETWRFTFDYRAAQPPFGPGGVSTTAAFVKVLDSVNSTFATLAEFQFDTTNASTDDWATSFIDLTIDSAWANQLVQFGFTNDSVGYSPTGVYYDNLNFSAIPEPAACSLLVVGMGLLGFRRKR